MIEVVTFAQEHLPAFIARNREWIEKMDVLQLDAAEQKIIQKGGEIFFSLIERTGFLSAHLQKIKISCPT